MFSISKQQSVLDISQLDVNENKSLTIYSKLCLIFTVIGFIVVYIPVYANGKNNNSIVFPNLLASPLQTAITSDEFNDALLLSLVISTPLLLDILLDSWSVIMRHQGNIFNWFIRLFMLFSLSFPSFLMISPPRGMFNYFDGEDAIKSLKAESYLCIESMKRISIVSNILLFILQNVNNDITKEKGNHSNNNQTAKKDNSNKLRKLYRNWFHYNYGVQIILTFITYLLGELFWLYHYLESGNTGTDGNNNTYNSNNNGTHSYRVLGIFFITLSYIFLIYFIIFWSRKKIPRKLKKKIKRTLKYYKVLPDNEVAPSVNINGGEDGNNNSFNNSAKYSNYSTKSNKINNNNNNSNSRKQSKDNEFLSSNDVLIYNFLTALFIFPIIGFVISYYQNNNEISGLELSIREVCGYIYIQITFTVFVIVIPTRLLKADISDRTQVIN